MSGECDSCGNHTLECVCVSEESLAKEFDEIMACLPPEAFGLLPDDASNKKPRTTYPSDMCSRPT
jgi:hypothetical protein